jgi:hypothetical protein
MFCLSSCLTCVDFVFCFLLLMLVFCRAAVAQDDSLCLWGAVLEGLYKTNIVENAELSILKTGVQTTHCLWFST